MCSTYRTAEANFGRVLPRVHLITVDVTWVVDGLEVPLVLRVAAKVLLEVAVPHQLQSAKIPNTMRNLFTKNNLLQYNIISDINSYRYVAYEYHNKHTTARECTPLQGNAHHWQ